MKKLFIRTGLALVCSMAGSVSAYDLTLNDDELTLTVNGVACELGSSNAPALVSVNVINDGSQKSVNISTTGGAGFECGGGVVQPPVSSSSSSVSSVSSISSISSSSSSSVAPPVGCGNGVWPNDVLQGAALNLASSPRASQSLLGNRTISFPVQASNPGKASIISISSLSNGLGNNRDVWISACPGGPALTGKGLCSVSGTESITLRALQGSGSVIYCSLESNQQYYINVTNKTCSSSTANCGFYRSIL